VPHKDNKAFNITKDVSLGSDFTCGIDSKSELSCWGLNNKGQTAVPKGVRQDALTVSAGNKHACAVKHVGKIFCWGDNYKLQNEVPH